MAITFGSNTTVNGTTANDTMIGTDPTGNTNDIVYGHQGDDTINFTSNGASLNTLYGGQGDDSISGLRDGGGNVVYGNFGNDIIRSVNDIGDTFYGGQGDDTIHTVRLSAGAVYGNLGNDSLLGDQNQSTNFYGGQGNDTVFDNLSNKDVIYGNFGDDLLFGGGTRNTHEYGGQGNDTLVFTGSVGISPTTNDFETGGLGNDLFIATNGSFGSTGDLNANDIVTITDFLQGNDLLAMSRNPDVPLDKIQGIGDNAAQALNDANNAYAGHTGSEYVFVYGGTGAGYLFYNGDNAPPGHPALSGMAILGANGENSVNASDITTIPSNIPA